MRAVWDALDATPGLLYERGMSNGGYDILVRISDEVGDLEGILCVRRHSDGHLWVEYCPACPMVEFAVASTDAAAFVVDRLPTMLLAAEAGLQTYALQTLSRAVVAFVRHGQGRDTIDEYGTETLDDVARAVRFARMAERSKRVVP